MRRLPFRLFLAIIASYATLALFACTPRNTGLEVHSVTGRTERVERRPALPLSVILGHSIEGRPIECHVFGGGDDVVLFMATIHGNESAGTPLLHELARYLAEHPSELGGRRVVLIPVANPDGYASGTRCNADGVDLNRNFPAANRKNSMRYGRSGFSEPESRAIQVAFERYRPDRIISIHQPRACIDYDGSAERLARLMGDAGDLRVQRLGTRPGSLGSYAPEVLGIPVITLELPRSADRYDASALWYRYGSMLLAAVEYAE